MTTARTGQPCDKCGSSDAKAYYEDGQTHCHKCHHHTFPDEDKDVHSSPPDPPEDMLRSSPPLAIGIAENVPSRGLQAATLAYYGVTVLK